MAIDWNSYEAFIADVKEAEKSDREWHCEYHNVLHDTWHRLALGHCPPDGYEYRVIYDPPAPPAAQPLELRVAELERKLADHCHCGGTMNVTVSNDPTDPYADATPNPLAEWRDKYYEALAEAYRLRGDNAKLTEEIERLLREVEQRQVNYNQERQWRQAAEKENKGLTLAIKAADSVLGTYNATGPALHDRVYALGMQMEKAEQEVERKRVELERIEQEFAEEAEKLRGEVARLTIQAQEWSLEAVIRRDKLNELQAYHDRREAEDRELDAAMDQVAANLPPVKPESGMLGKLRQALGMESGSIRETVDAAVDRIARLSHRLAVFEGFVVAQATYAARTWDHTHGCPGGEAWTYEESARRCRELAGEVG